MQPLQWPQERVPPHVSPRSTQPGPEQGWSTHTWAPASVVAALEALDAVDDARLDDPLVGHTPQSSMPPQPSLTDPHDTPRAAQVVGTQTGTEEDDEEEEEEEDEIGHAPQSSVPPQPSLMPPHDTPAAAQVVGTQVDAADDADVTGHAPQSSKPPQPSLVPPHETPAAAQVVGTQLVAVAPRVAVDAEPPATLARELDVEREVDSLRPPSAEVSLPTTTTPHAVASRPSPSTGSARTRRLARAGFMGLSPHGEWAPPSVS